MAQLKKFMFDNFVIKKAEEEEEVLPVEEVIEPEIIAEPELEETPAEEVAVIEPEPEPEPEPEAEEETPEPPVKIYTQEEVDELVNNASQDGYERGFKSAQSGVEAETDTLLNEINQKLIALVTEREQLSAEFEQQALDVAVAVIRKMVPSLQADNAAELVSQFIADNFNNFKQEAKLSFYIHPDIISYVQEKIAKLANSYDFEGKIALHKAPDLAKNECRIEWENGGVELNGTARLQQITSMLESNRDQKPEKKDE